MIIPFITKIFGSANDRALQKLQVVVDAINVLEPSMQQLSDEELRAKTQEFRQALSGGKTLEHILPEAFAVVREACLRTTGLRPYDVQLMGALVLHQGKVAEMKTGEGKTLTATLALYVNALESKGAHLVTVNDYLAKRDSAWNKPIYEFLGMTVGVIYHDMSDVERKAQYNCDVLYITNNELGFDYLRDNMKFRYKDYVQRELNFAIIDECDSILIDEARTPLIISGPANRSFDSYEKVNAAVGRLEKGTDYEVDEKMRSVQLTEVGHDKIEESLHVNNLYAVENINILHHVNQALRAHSLYRKDVEYVVRNGQVLIVDEFTGRILSGRRYSDGLHQAIEAKEQVEIEDESQTLASITLQNFFRMYQKLSGMTGTAMTEAEEFAKIYNLDVVAIPTNKPMIRQDKDDVIFLSEVGKMKAVVEDVRLRHKQGQPILIGTIAVEKSELLSHILGREGIEHEVLNAKQHTREADIVAMAGQPGRVTIATNMAGRGTDIKLHPDSVAAGGLYVLGTERHESRRIDNQLRGRSGRQGDPGESRFYISLDDELIRIFAGDSIKKNMLMVGMTEDERIESSIVSKTIERSQQRVEKNNFEIRKNLIEYDDVLNQHRKVIYTLRQQLLKDADNIYRIACDMIAGTIEDIVYVQQPMSLEPINAEQKALILDQVKKIVSIDESVILQQKFRTDSALFFVQDMSDWLILYYSEFRQQLDKAHVDQAERWLMLETIDQAWKQHMINIDQLKDGINLRSWGNKNPLIEYKKEAYEMFVDMIHQIRLDIASHLLRMQQEAVNQVELIARREREMKDLVMTSADESKSESTAAVVEEKQARNEMCACGSGKKYKKCCR